MKRYIAILVILLFSGLSLWAEEPSFAMSAPGIVKVGEQFSLTLSLNAKGEDLRMPSLDNFTILMGPSVSSSQSISIVNGKVNQSVNYSYTYVLRAEQEGTFTISPATIKADRKVVQSNQVTIKAIQGQASSGQNQGGQSQQSTRSKTDQGSGSTSVGSRENMFIAFEADKRNVYKGEMIGVTFKLYSRVSLSIADQTLPSFEGFWSQEIEVPDAEQTRTREAVDGVIYNVYTLKKWVLIPQQTGKLTIEPAEMIFNVQQRVAPQSIFDDFFGSYQNVKVKSTSDRVNINVKDLPPAPAGFKGAVGDFSMTSSIDREQLKANEAITVKVVVSGSGNLRHIAPLDFNFPADFEVYDPKTTYNHKVTMSGVSGTTTFEHLIIPRYAGEFTIPSRPFVFFNPKTQSYKSINTQTFNIKVEKGSDDNGQAMVSGVSKENIQYIGQDIRFIKKGDPGLRHLNNFFFGSAIFYLLYIAGLLVFASIMVVQRKRARENADVALMRNRKANKIVRKHLKAAALCVKKNDKDQFFETLLKAFWGYLSDKLTLPLSELSRDNARSTLSSCQVEPEIIDDFIQVVDTCEMARYAPSAVTESIDDLYKKAEKLIGTFEKQIRKKA